MQPTVLQIIDAKIKENILEKTMSENVKIHCGKHRL